MGMERSELDFVLKHNHYLEGGTKEACVKAGEFIRNSMNPGNQLHAPLSCVKANEFVEAVKTLIAFTFQQDDTIPEQWKCDSDCHMIGTLFCSGLGNISKTADKTCPFFMDEGLI